RGGNRQGCENRAGCLRGGSGGLSRPVFPCLGRLCFHAAKEKGNLLFPWQRSGQDGSPSRIFLQPEYPAHRRGLLGGADGKLPALICSYCIAGGEYVDMPASTRSELVVLTHVVIPKPVPTFGRHALKT